MSSKALRTGVFTNLYANTTMIQGDRAFNLLINHAKSRSDRPVIGSLLVRSHNKVRIIEALN
ncbi:hypothetical protein H6F86_01460 [Phormidium sp. FACHB-592]|uniref:Uncharacterized protein n=1 Tax=Stenomitos frigidus AS-A4 TaxID=2933935 RepID=A0ABV0KLT0_9CYAN|nr:hypothetical protein [Phormidium sp. FACHB-592]MBD2072572.1 hypothetical protein [Phormidium sp. FACHB-592]